MNLFSFIKSRLSILDIIGQYTTLKKAGLYYKSCCPFHHEKTASFTVSPSKEIFYCFGCHAAGDLISFISKIENCSQIEAAKHLIDRYSISVPEQLNEKNAFTTNFIDKKKYYDLCGFVAQWAHENLRKNNNATSYLINRNINKESIIEFNIGYFPNGLSSMKDLLSFMQKKSFMAQDLINANILQEKNGELFSPFEERIIFPIKDHLGRTCGFGGRIFNEKDVRVKYYNSHDHQFFNKSSILFGLDKAKKYIQSTGYAFLVEGYTDVIAMYQSKYLNTIATLGTACTQEHLKQLAHYTDKLYILYDGDPAGQKAIMRLTTLCWQVNLDLYVIKLTENEDPDSFLRKEGDLHKLIEKAEDIFEFFIQTTASDFSNKSLQNKLIQTKKILELISLVADPLKKDLLLQKGALLCSIPLQTLKDQLKPLSSGALVKPTTDTPTMAALKASSQDEREGKFKGKEFIEISLLEKQLLCAIISNEINISFDDEDLLLKWLDQSIAKFLKKFLELKKINKDIQAKDLFDILNFQEKEELSKYIIEAQINNNNTLKDQLILQFYKKQWKLIIHNVKLEIELAQKIGDMDLVKKLLSKLEANKKIMLYRGII